jgi:hypothetical protein
VDKVEPNGFAELMADLAVSLGRPQTVGRQPDLVSDIVDGAVTIIPGVRAAAVLRLTGDGMLTAPIVRGEHVVRAVMDAQNQWGQGPSLDAWRDNKQVVILDVAADPRWPEFSRRMAGLRVRCMVCTLMGDSIDFDDVDEDTAMMARVFAAHAGLAMTGEQHAADATAALSTRDVIGQAKGILMERFGLTADAAFAVLVKASSETNTKLRIVCEQLCLTGVLEAQDPRSR